jgi:membrane peptidoglycan carboxypeptidase
MQLAAAYGAIANDGVLLQPTLIREVREPDGGGGGVQYRHVPEPVRRAVTPEVAARLRDLLRGVVEEGGTGERAALANYQVAAKTGTARRVVAGRYASGQYTASFAALFPAGDPQLVVVMKIDNPQKGSYFAAQTAAPVTRSMLEQALAARTVAIDRARLSNVAMTADRAGEGTLEEPDGLVPYVVSWPYVADTAQAQTERAVPNTTGTPLREAARTLHRRGFKVVVKGWGVVHHTWPAAGEQAVSGSTVTVFAEPLPPKSRP